MSPNIFQDFKSYPDPLALPSTPVSQSTPLPSDGGCLIPVPALSRPSSVTVQVTYTLWAQCPSHRIVVGIKWISIRKLLKQCLAHGTWYVIAGYCSVTAGILPLPHLTILLGQLRVSSSSDLGCIYFYVTLDQEVHINRRLLTTLKYFKSCIISYLGLSTYTLYSSNPKNHSHNT